LERYVITKGLSKHPNDYPDGNVLPHVFVAKQMLKHGRPVSTGDHIPYVITSPIEQEPGDQPLAKAATMAERARHPDEIARSNGILKPDIEWYLTQQILPPISRLCEPIDGTSQQMLAQKLGLDSARYNQSNGAKNDIDADIDFDYVPASFLPDNERFKNVDRLQITCFSCGVESEFPGVFGAIKDGEAIPSSGLRCTNQGCQRPTFWGQANHFECYARITNSMSLWVRRRTCQYYQGRVRCDEPSCGLVTRQLSVAGSICLRRGCHGKMIALDGERDVHTHLKYLERLFDIEHAREQLKKKSFSKDDLAISKLDESTFKELHAVAKHHLDSNAYNFIKPIFWRGLVPSGMNMINMP
jgi:DNA polymerase alpha subunit A